MFQEKCYKLVREKKSHVRAQRYCEEQGKGGQIAFPHTHVQVRLLQRYFSGLLNLYLNIELHSSNRICNILQKQFLENLVKHSDKNVTNDLTYDAWLYPRGNLMVLNLIDISVLCF